jgi:hypothetical protein
MMGAFLAGDSFGAPAMLVCLLPWTDLGPAGIQRP